MYVPNRRDFLFNEDVLIGSGLLKPKAIPKPKAKSPMGSLLYCAGHGMQPVTHYTPDTGMCKLECGCIRHK
jgi:hypothetical protein